VRYYSIIAVLSAAVVAGCGSSTEQKSPPPAAANVKFVLATEPAAAQEVIAVRSNAKDDEKLVVVGRIGGDAKPWVTGQAAFTIVDTSLKPCGTDEGCPTPWDYCCSSDLSKSKLTVKVVDAEGRTVATDAKELLGVKELDTVVIRGKAKRDAAGNVTILADGLYVRR
jgi:hypothetical protein